MGKITLFSATSSFSLYECLIYLYFFLSLEVVVVSVVAVCLQSKYSIIILREQLLLNVYIRFACAKNEACLESVLSSASML